MKPFIIKLKAIMAMMVLICTSAVSFAAEPSFEVNQVAAIAPGGETTITLSLNTNATDASPLPVYSMQFTINLPEGLSLKESSDNYIDATLGSDWGGFLFMGKVNVGKCVIYDKANTGKTFSGTVEVVTMTVVADATFSGDQTASLSDCMVVSQRDGTGGKIGNTEFTIKSAPVEIKVESVTLKAQSSTTVKVGETVSLEATVLPGNATDKGVTWTSSDETVATVSEAGVVTAKAVGSAEITASAGGIKSEPVTITVTAGNTEPVLVESITFTDTEPASLEVGGTIKLAVSVLPVNATDKSLSWSSSKPEVAAVDENGTVTAVSVGTTVITAKANDNSGRSATFNVTVKATLVKSIEISGANQVVRGSQITLTATVKPDNATDKSVEWSTSDAAIATVNNGVVTGVGKGLAKITVISKDGSGVSAVKDITVLGIAATSVTISGAEDGQTIKKGQIVNLTATVKPDNADDLTVTWSSDNEEMATVSADGVVTAGAVLGNVKITATANGASGVSASIQFEVVATPATSVKIAAPEKVELKDGETVTLTANVGPEDATDKSVAWSSSDEEIATVSENGVVTAKAKLGEVTITATAKGAESKEVKDVITLKVIPTPAKKISIFTKTAAADFKVGSELQFIANVEPANATNKKVVWSSSNASIATIDAETGLAEGKAPGMVTITATAADGSGVYHSITLEVHPVLWETLTINFEKYEMIVGEKVTMKVSGTPDNVTDKSLTLVVEPEGIFDVTEIDSNGNFTLEAKKECEEAKVMVKANDSSGKEATVSVEVSSELTLVGTEELLDEDGMLPQNSTMKILANTYAPVTWSIVDISGTESETASRSIANKKCEGAEIVREFTNPSAVEVKGLKKDAIVSVIATLADGTTSQYYNISISEPKDINAESISITPKAVTLTVGSSISLSAVVSPDNCSNGPAEWSTSNSAVATVSSDGFVSAVSIGVAYITARTVNADGTSLTATAEINVITPSGIAGVDCDGNNGVRVVDGEIVVEGNGKVEIFNITGARVAVATDGKVSGLPHGIYIVRSSDKSIKVRL